MTPNKAREFYSDYLEGTLEGGLRESFERALARDAELQYDFESFKDAMSRLSEVDSSEVPVPAGLFDQISQRVDASFPVKAPKPRLWLIENLRPVLAVGAAASVIGLAVISIQNNKGGDVGTSGVVTIKEDASPTVAMRDGSVNFSYKPSADDKITFKDGDTSEVLETRTVTKGTLFSEPLTNPRMEAGIIIIEFSSQPDSNLRVALPGRIPSADLSNEGTVLDLAKMLSSSFDRAIRLDIKNPDRTVTWNFEDGATISQVRTKLKDLDLDITEMNSGLLVLTD